MENKEFADWLLAKDNDDLSLLDIADYQDIGTSLIANGEQQKAQQIAVLFGESMSSFKSVSWQQLHIAVLETLVNGHRHLNEIRDELQDTGWDDISRRDILKHLDSLSAQDMVKKIRVDGERRYRIRTRGVHRLNGEWTNPYA